MSLVSTRSRALWPPISDWLRSILLWILPGDCASEKTGSTDQSTNGRLATRASRLRRNRMRARMLGNAHKAACTVCCKVQDFLECKSS